MTIKEIQEKVIWNIASDLSDYKSDLPLNVLVNDLRTVGLSNLISLLEESHYNKQILRAYRNNLLTETIEDQ